MISAALMCLAMNVYHEARSEPMIGQYAVAHVVVNRVQSTKYPNDVCAVVHQGFHKGKHRCQFSWYCDGKSDRVPEGSENWVRAQMVAWEMMREGRFRGITEGATHYHATYVSPRWRSDRGMDLIGRIGSHIFYRWN
jgi:spore germination cell wall hydrolase CwlJ-like protein